MAVVLNYRPHEAQRAIHAARGKRFRTVCTGRRLGKKLCLAAECGIEASRDIADGYIKVIGRMPTRVKFEGAVGGVSLSSCVKRCARAIASAGA